MKKIEITIGPDGDSTIDLSNFKGKGCEKVFADFAGDDKPIMSFNKREHREVESQKEKQQA